MAYGVKYRLEFSDNEENGKKIEIWKDGYVGQAKTVIGGAEPITIKWNAQNDIYSPIIGSTAIINLVVTDDVTYDDFYSADEREYQVKVFYKDGSDTYQLYWIGWLVADRYKEVIQSTPYSLQLNAIDGLGTLNSFDSPLYYKDISGDDRETALPPINYIADILGNLDLGLSIYTSNELEHRTLGSGNNIYDQMWEAVGTNPRPAYALTKKFKVQNAKFVLEQILNYTHSRIFQSYGRWYVINKSTYSASITGGSESISFDIFTSAGVFSSTSSSDVLYDTPSDLKVFKRKLSKLYDPPLKKVRIPQSLENNYDYKTNNFSFEWSNGDGTNEVGWTINALAVFNSDKTLTGGNAIRFTGGSGIITSDGTGQLITTETYKFDFSAYTSYSGTNNIGVKIQAGSMYWDEPNETWTSTVTTNTIDLGGANEINKWQTKTFELPEVTSTMTGITITVSGGTSTTTNPIYIDNLGIFVKFDSYGASDRFLERVRTTGDYSNIYELEQSYLIDGRVYEYIQDANTDMVRPSDTAAITIEEIITQYILNDYRDYLPRYEGDFYNTTNPPIGLHNKVLINFTGLSESRSCYIDAMTYKVKSNVYNVRMHIPNQTSDISSNVVESYE